MAEKQRSPAEILAIIDEAAELKLAPREVVAKYGIGRSTWSHWKSREKIYRKRVNGSTPAKSSARRATTNPKKAAPAFGQKLIEVEQLRESNERMAEELRQTQERLTKTERLLLDLLTI